MENRLRVARRCFSDSMKGWIGRTASLASEDVIFRLSAGDLYVGLEGVGRAFQERAHLWQDAWFEERRAEALAGDWVLLEGRAVLRLRSGEEQAQPGAWLVRVRGEQVTDWLYYRTAAQAREAIRATDPRALEETGVPADLSDPTVEDLGSGYHVLQRNPSSPDDETLLILSQAGAPVAAFPFESRDAAINAIPPSLRVRTPTAVAEEAVSAVVSGDVAAILDVLTDDFTYTDEAHGVGAEDKATMLNWLLMVHDAIKSGGLQDLRIEPGANGTVTISGRSTLPETADVPGGELAWTVTAGTEDGRIKWAARGRDREPEPAE